MEESDINRESSVSVIQSNESIKPPIRPCSADQTIKIISEIYSQLPSEIAVHFVDPSVVLAVAGMKGKSNIHLVSENKQAAAVQIEAINQITDKYGLKINYNRRLETDDPDFTLSLTSLRGYQYSTARMTLMRKFGVPVFEGSDWNRYWAWYNQVFDIFEQLAAHGEITRDTAEIYIQGIILGYPDTAIIDYGKAYSHHLQDKLENADIISVHPLAQKYHGAVPEFDYAPSSATDPQITEYIQNARNVLLGFYNSDFMQNLTRDDNFVETRKQEDQNWNQYVSKLPSLKQVSSTKKLFPPQLKQTEIAI